MRYHYKKMLLAALAFEAAFVQVASSGHVHDRELLYATRDAVLRDRGDNDGRELPTKNRTSIDPPPNPPLRDTSDRELPPESVQFATRDAVSLPDRDDNDGRELPTNLKEDRHPPPEVLHDNSNRQLREPVQFATRDAVSLPDLDDNDGRELPTKQRWWNWRHWNNFWRWYNWNRRWYNCRYYWHWYCY